MSIVYIAEPFDSYKDKFRVVAKLERELIKKRRKGRIEIDTDKKCVICTYDEPDKLYN